MPKGISANLRGKVFGNLTVIDFEGKDKKHQNLWRCKCICGNEKVLTTGNLNRGDHVSCGCMKGGHKKHGYAYSSTYKVWRLMKNRCFNSSDPYYHNYGGRGITVCERWLTFENFLNDMGNKPDKKTLDRIENDGNYEPLNCKWSDWQDQCFNTRAKGYTWSEKHGKWIAQIMLDGVHHYLGLFDSKEEAHSTYLTAKEMYHQRDERPEVVKRLHNCWDRLYSAI